MRNKLTEGENAILTWLLLPQEVRSAYMLLFSFPLCDIAWRDWATCKANGYTERRMDTTVDPPRFKTVITEAGLNALWHHYRR